ncbi:unnamed protein product [Fraxinus pennsylvanica]|uniref:Uncharacterized protein n=1 Tax=Fraxinus pennsylvanica TaxID=56036 RepID=A0AAD1YR65_9LAMI|nr:unnamed protein product [Fraxinus pennsylvanica]
MNCLRNPYLISRFFSMVPQAHNFCKWGALILALLATFSSIIRRIKIIFIHLHAFKPSPSQAFVQSNDFEFSDDDECSSVSSQEEEGSSPATSFQDQQAVDEDFCVKGSNFYLRSQSQNGNLRNRGRQCCGGEWLPLSEFTSGKNVVKLWDYWTIPEVTVASPECFLTEEGNGKGDRVVFNGYDTRMPRRVPAISAKWRSPAAAVTEVVSSATGGVEKFYMRDTATGVLTVGDVRNLTAPVENVAEYDGDTWQDADFVFVD